MPGKGSDKVRAIVLTVNNYEEGDLEKIEAADWVRYSVIGKEVAPTTGTPHLQGYIQLEKRERLSAVTKRLNELLGKAVFTEKAKAGLKANKAYCSKSGEVHESGEPVSQGTRTDVKKFLEAAASGMRDCELAEEYPLEFAKYHKAGERARRDKAQQEGEAAMRAIYKDAELREWQQKIVERLEKQSDRKVLWVVDEKGGKGKSWLGNWLLANKEAFLVEGGKVADIAHAFKCQEWVAIDLTRAQAEKTEYIYSVIESFKNGRIFSPKYESAMKLFKPCKVVVFANWQPDRTKLSEDRWEIVDLEVRTPAPWNMAETYAREMRERAARAEDVQTEAADEKWDDTTLF